MRPVPATLAPRARGRNRAIRGCAIATALGGSGWVAKGTTIVLDGPDWLEAGYSGIALFPLGLVALSLLLGERGGRPATAGRWSLAVAAAAFVLAIASSPAGAGGRPPLAGQVALGTAGGAIFLSVLLLGIATRRTRALAPPWHGLPLAMGVAAVPLMLLSGLLADLAGDERLIEIPIVAFGIGFIGLGIALWRTSEPTAS